MPFWDDPVSLPSNGWEPWLETAPTEFGKTSKQLYITKIALKANV